MRSRNRILIILQILLFKVTLILNCSGQEITIIESETEELDIINDTSIVRDQNGEICSLAIINSNISNIKFYSNRGIERVTFDSSKYFVWFPSEATVLKFVVPDFPLVEHKLGNSSRPTVYLFILSIPELNPTIVFKNDTLSKKVSLISIPKKAGVFQGRNKMGITPLIFSTTELCFDQPLEIKKIGYLTEIKYLDSAQIEVEYNVHLSKQSSQKQLFMTFSAGIVRENNFNKPIIGIQIGKLGKLGFYGSISGFYFDSNKTTFNEISFVKAYGGSISGGGIIALNSFSHLSMGLGCRRSVEFREEYITYNVAPDIQSNWYLDYGLIIRYGEFGKGLLWLESTYWLSPADILSYYVACGIGFAF